jgi:hypothetical protein
MPRPITPALLAQAEKLINDEKLSGREAARRLHLSEAGLRDARKRSRRTEPSRRDPKVTTDGDNASITGPATEGQVSLADSEALMRSRGFDPAEWEVRSATVNEWEGPSEDGTRTYHQLKIQLQRRTPTEWIFPAVDVKPRPLPKRRTGASSFLAVIVGDQQAPYHDPGLHGCFLQFLADVKPQRGVSLGDGADFPTISRHRDNPGWAAPVQECIQAFFQVLCDYRDASPDTAWQLLKGNHDHRLETELLNRAERMFGIRPADYPGEAKQDQALSLNRLLHLDRLGVELVEPPVVGDNYEHAQVNLSSQLGVRHGWLTGENTAAKTLDRLGHSVVVGHTHAQRCTQQTRYDIAGTPTTITCWEAGTMAQIRDGLGFAVRPSWQQGFVTAQVWPDGSFHVDPATFKDGALYWRDRCWRARGGLRVAA